MEVNELGRAERFIIVEICCGGGERAYAVIDKWREFVAMPIMEMRPLTEIIGRLEQIVRRLRETTMEITESQPKSWQIYQTKIRNYEKLIEKIKEHSRT